MPKWHAHVLTLFPDLFPGPLGISLLGKALTAKLWSCSAYNLRDYADPPHYSVDDIPYGGGPGMVMKPDVVARAFDALKIEGPIISLTPSGKPFTQKLAQDLLKHNNVTFLCGRYEGVDARLENEYELHHISIGDFVLAGGELPAMTIIEACVRLIPGVLGTIESVLSESFSHPYLLEHEHYTRPTIWRGHSVPEILTSGHHAKIQQWRDQRMYDRTKKIRPDLWDKLQENKSKK
ncbi:MAG: tRNA (guanosine(37)-N1)-methyltransferase TrmD [Alphaproteobacteria bacterium]|nr:tRNA (guanosine(37)-N1)-methyltransferase TrmD [Alphaproteobacteria bacterium]